MLKKLSVKITEENAESHLSDQDIEEYMQWLKEGASTTVEGFQALDEDEKMDIIEYLEEFSTCHELTVNGKRYILVHAGINNFDEEKELEDYTLHDLVFCRMDYSKRYFADENTFIVTGHTPTPIIREDKKPLVYEENGHIAIDCGCVFGGRLAAYCLDTGEVHYVEGKK
jgi:serine/threonine protein phosphatase 1